jgi:hypothetical protein
MDGENPASRKLFYVPRTLFTLQGRHPWTSFDLGRDGRFLGIVPEVLVTEQPLTVVVNWTAERGESARR